MIDSLIPNEVRLVLHEETTFSPSKRYKYHLEHARVKFTNILISRVVISSIPEKSVIAEVDIQGCNPNEYWHNWIQSGDKKEYLLLKGIQKGALLISMSSGAIADLITEYVWKQATISPNNDKLAVLCDKQSKVPIRVFDFRNVSNPPFLEMKTSGLPVIEKAKYYQSEISWMDNIHLTVAIPVHKRDTLAFGFSYYIEEITMEVYPVDGITTVVTGNSVQIKGNKHRPSKTFGVAEKRYQSSDSGSQSDSWSDSESDSDSDFQPAPPERPSNGRPRDDRRR